MSGPPPPKTIENEERAIEQLRFQQQCFLSMYWDTFAQANQGHTYDQFVQISGNSANSFVSPNEVVEKLTSVPGLSSLMKAPPLVVSSLMPEVRLFKVTDGTSDAKEFLFDDHMAAERISSMTSSAAGRGQGVSLVSFEWTKNGRDPGEANSSIQVKMKLFFSSMMDLETELDTGLKWLDLIAPSPGSTGDPNGTSPYKIRALVGYTQPNAKMWESFGIKKETFSKMSEAIKHAKISLYLNIVKHELTLLDGGGIELSLEYFAALEGILSDSRSDVLLLGITKDQRKEVQETGQVKAHKESDEKKKNLRQQLSEERCERDRAAEDSEDRERRQKAMDKISEDIEELEKAREKEQGERYRKLLEIIEQSGRVFKIKVKAEDLGRLNSKQLQEREASRTRTRTEATRQDILNQLSGQPSDTRPNLNDLQEAAAAQNQERTFRKDISRTDQIQEVRSDITEDPGGSDELEISFIYYGDLLNVALKVLKPAANGGLGADAKKELKPIVGPYTWTDMMDGTQKAINLADVPISLENFKVWFLDNVIGPQRQSYPLKAFIRDTITKLVANCLTPRCFGLDQGTQSVPKIGINIFDAPMAMNGETPDDRVKPGCKDSLCFGKKRLSLNDIKGFPEVVPDGGHMMASYLLIFCSSTSSRRLTGNEEQDDKMGRYWMRMGTTGGLVKEIKFKAQDQEGTREMRIERMGRAGYLHEIYDADLTLFGCPIFSPGCLVYIDPSSIGIGVPSAVRELALNLGMGGYYMILEATTVIEKGTFETSLKTVFEAPGTGKPNVTVDPDANPCSKPAKNGETPTPGGATPSLPSVSEGGS